MSLFNAIFIYILIWWVTLFMVLPMGVERDEAAGRGHDAGAPKVAGLKKKLLINTLLAAAILGVVQVLVLTDVIQWRAWFDDGGWR